MIWNEYNENPSPTRQHWCENICLLFNLWKTRGGFSGTVVTEFGSFAPVVTHFHCSVLSKHSLTYIFSVVVNISVFEIHAGLTSYPVLHIQHSVGVGGQWFSLRGNNASVPGCREAMGFTRPHRDYWVQSADTQNCCSNRISSSQSLGSGCVNNQTLPLSACC